MTLLQPLMLLGLLGLGLPLLAHLLGRDRPRPIAIASLRFATAGDPVVTRRRTLRDPPLLLLRLLLLALLVVALARPTGEAQRELSVLAAPHDAVLMIDGSHSMELRVDGERLLERAQEVAETLLRSLPPGSRVGLITSDPEGPRIELTADPAVVRRELDSWIQQVARARHRHRGSWTLDSQLPAALAALETARNVGRAVHEERAIYAIGDRSERGLGSLPPSIEGVPIILVPVLATLGRESLEATTADADPRPEHVGIEHAGWSPARDLDPRAVRVTGSVRRYRPGAELHDPSDTSGGTERAGEERSGDAADARAVTVALRVDGQRVAQAEVEVRGDRPAPFEFTHTLSGEGGPRPAVVELLLDADDPLPGDDAVYLWLSASDRVQVTVVNGDPSEMRTHDEVFFLATALAASSADSGRAIELRSLAPEQFEERVRERGVDALEDTDVLVLTNVRAPSEDVAPALQAAVQRGLGLWISVGERVRARDYNDRLGPMLPLLMRETVVAGTAPGRAEARTEGLAPADLTHPALRGLTGDLGLTGTRTRRMVLLEPDPTRTAAVALTYTNGAPALITREFGRGRVALLTTSIDRDWTDMPLRPGFVPLVERVLAYLASARRGAASTRLMVGEPWRLASDAPVAIRTPSGELVLEAPDERGLIELTDTRAPGHYRVEPAADAEAPASARQAPVCSVNVDPVESRTAPVFSPGDTSAVEAGADNSQPKARPARAQRPRWRPLVWLAALLLLAETLLRRWRRRGKNP